MHVNVWLATVTFPMYTEKAVGRSRLHQPHQFMLFTVLYTRTYIGFWWVRNMRRRTIGYSMQRQVHLTSRVPAFKSELRANWDKCDVRCTENEQCIKCALCKIVCQSSSLLQKRCRPSEKIVHTIAVCFYYHKSKSAFTCKEESKSDYL